MDTTVAMQKLVRLRALSQYSPLSSNDDLVQLKKEPLPVVLSPLPSPSPVLEPAPQDIRISRSWTSLAQSVHSTPEKPLHRVTILLPKHLRRALSSPLSSLMLPSNSKGKRRAEKDDGSASRKEGRASVSGTGLANYTGPKTIWTDHDSFLPRAKPPPPLKRTKHARNRSETVSPPDPTIPGRLSASYAESSGQSSESRSSVSCSSRRSLDVPAIEVSCEDSDPPAVNVQHTLTRTDTRTTVASGASEDSDIIFAQSSLNWQPPTCWAGPSKIISADEDHRPKLGGWFTKKISVQSSSKGGSLQVPTRLGRVQSIKKMMHVHLADTAEPEEETSIILGRPLSSGVIVKIQCCEGDAWHEKPMSDIIPKLRELRFK